MREPIIEIHPDSPRDADFLKQIDQFKTRLADDNELSALAMHEAGHELFYRKMGLTKFDYFGPVAGPGRNAFFGASILPTHGTDEFINLKPLTRIHLVAKANTAGGSVTKFILERSDRGNLADFNGFTASGCAIASENNLVLDLNKIWTAAEIETDREVRLPDIKQEIEKIAVRIKPLLFKWLD